MCFALGLTDADSFAKSEEELRQQQRQQQQQQQQRGGGDEGREGGDENNHDDRDSSHETVGLKLKASDHGHASCFDISQLVAANGPFFGKAAVNDGVEHFQGRPLILLS